MIENFSCVEWVRNIRNKEYEDNKHLTLAEYSEKVSKEIQDSPVFKELITNRGVRIISPSLAK
jgi:deoxyhypusine synthase